MADNESYYYSQYTGPEVDLSVGSQTAVVPSLSEASPGAPANKLYIRSSDATLHCNLNGDGNFVQLTPSVSSVPIFGLNSTVDDDVSMNGTIAKFSITQNGSTQSYPITKIVMSSSDFSMFLDVNVHSNPGNPNNANPVSRIRWCNNGALYSAPLMSTTMCYATSAPSVHATDPNTGLSDTNQFRVAIVSGANTIEEYRAGWLYFITES